MRYLSMFSGIEAATAAWHPLGWEPAAFCEIESFPSAVLAHHYPHVPNLGDVTKADFDAIGPIDLAVFGSPCQSYSIAGKRLGLDDPRGNLALIAGGIVYRKRPSWFVFENVPGLLSSDEGWDFGTILAAFAGYPSGSVFTPPADGWGNAGVIVQANAQSYGLAWRVLDAQYFGVPQRRRRVFVVGYLGDWRRAAAVLFERHSLSGDPAPRREKGQNAPTIPSRSTGGGGLGTDFDCDGGLVADWPAEVCPTLDTYYGDKMGLEDQHVFNQRGGKFVRGEPVAFGWQNSASQGDGVGEIVATLDKSKTPAVAFAQNTRDEVRLFGGDGQVVGALAAQPGMKQQSYVAFDMRGRDGGAQFEGPHDTANIRAASGGSSRSYVAASAVRRLTPRECERLQGFPDDLTLVPYRNKPAADGPRYKALGNSMAVPVMRFIGERIAAVEALAEQRIAA